VAVGAVALAAAAGGALSGCHPTGTPVVDPVYTATFAGLVTLAGSRARRLTLLWLSVLAVGLSRGLLLAPAGAALLGAFASTFQRRPGPAERAVIVAVSVEVILRWPAVGFQGLTALLAAAAVTPVLVSALRCSRRKVRRAALYAAGSLVALAAVLSIPLAITTLLGRRTVDAGMAEAHRALSGASSGRLAAATQRMRHTADSLDNLAILRWWTAGADLVPVVSQQRAALVGALDAAGRLLSAAAAEAPRIGLSSFDTGGGHLGLARLAGAAAPLRSLTADIAAAELRLSRLHSAWLLPPIEHRLARVETELGSAERTAHLVAETAADAPNLLGATGVRRYLVLFMNPAESRGLDGLVSAYAELTVSDGHLSISRSGSSITLNSADPADRHISGPADYLARYGSFDPADHFQDLTYSPDFPTVAEVSAQVFAEATRTHVNGVLALDPYSLARLLELTGPIRVAGLGQSLTSTNAANFLVTEEYILFPAQGEQTVRHDFLSEALDEAFARLRSEPISDPLTLAAQLGSDVRDGHLYFWSFTRSDQPLLRQTGLAGDFPAVGSGDLLAVTTQNADNNKIGAYLERSIDDQVDYDPGTGAVSATVTVTLHNNAPASGLPPYVIGSYQGSGLPSGTNRTWLSIYSPLQLLGATEDQAGLPMGSTPELGVNAYSAFVDIPAESTVTVVVHLSGQIAERSTYTIRIRRQPTVETAREVITVHPAPGWAARAGALTWMPSAAAVQVHRIAFTHAS